MHIEVYESLAGQWRWRFRSGQRVTEIYAPEESRAKAIKVAKDVVRAIFHSLDPHRRIDFSNPTWCERGCWIVHIEAPRINGWSELGNALR